MKEEKKQIDPKVLNEIIEAIGKIKYGEVSLQFMTLKSFRLKKKRKKRFN